MAVKREEIYVLTLRRLDEAYTSTAGEISTGAGAVLEVTSAWAQGTGTAQSTQQTIYDLITQAVYEWCRTAYYLPGTATQTWASGASSYRLSALTIPSGQGNLWAAQTLTTTAGTETRLPKTPAGSFRLHYPDYQITSGTPSTWTQESSSILLNVKPSTNTAIKVYGPCYPETPSASVDLSFMDDNDIRRVIPLITAILLVRRKFAHTNLFGRLGELTAEYSDLYNRFRAEISKPLRDEFFQEMSADLMPVKK
jgi:hypothetical protein